jgi:hypothetical protein
MDERIGMPEIKSPPKTQINGKSMPSIPINLRREIYEMITLLFLLLNTITSNSCGSSF